MNPKLAQYIEREIIPRYTTFDRAHRTDHVRTVIAQSLALAAHYDVDIDMVYTIAAYHDTGLVNGRENHHTDSGKILITDPELHRWFSDEQIATMHDAVEDHRASSAHEPRTIYGRIVAEADRCIDAQTILRRTVQYGLTHYPELDNQGHYARCLEHLNRKYAEGGYLKLWIPESDNARRLTELRAMIRDQARLRTWFDDIFTHETDPRLEVCARSFRAQTNSGAESLRLCSASRSLTNGRIKEIKGYLVNGEYVIDIETHEILPREAFCQIDDLATPNID